MRHSSPTYKCKVLWDYKERNVREGEALVECAGAKQAAKGTGWSGWECNKDRRIHHHQVLGH